MAIYAISDLHLSFNRPVGLYDIVPEKDVDKPMDVFGWERHYDQIRDHWLEVVTPHDTVLIPGDISWAIRLNQACYDLNWINLLPGNKVLSPGNHCYYAQSKKKMRDALPEGMQWLDADFTVVEEKIVAATRGWNLPGDRVYKEETDRKIYERQVGRLHLALDKASRQFPHLSKIVMLHFPPVTKYVQNSGFMDVMKQFGVTHCVYGHLHGKAAFDAIEGIIDGIHLKLVSCDALGFRPVRIE